MSANFGRKLKELRLECGYSQKQLAEVFHVTNVTISSWEINKQEPCMDDIAKIANYFNVSTDYLLGLSEDRERFETYCGDQTVRKPNESSYNFYLPHKEPAKQENGRVSTKEQTLLKLFRGLSDEKKSLLVKLLS